MDGRGEANDWATYGGWGCRGVSRCIDTLRAWHAWYLSQDRFLRGLFNCFSRGMDPPGLPDCWAIRWARCLGAGPRRGTKATGNWAKGPDFGPLGLKALPERLCRPRTEFRHALPLPSGGLGVRTGPQVTWRSPERVPANGSLLAGLGRTP